LYNKVIPLKREEVDGMLGIDMFGRAAAAAIVIMMIIMVAVNSMYDPVGAGVQTTVDSTEGLTSYDPSPFSYGDFWYSPGSTTHGRVRVGFAGSRDTGWVEFRPTPDATLDTDYQVGCTRGGVFVPLSDATLREDVIRDRGC
jgi:hypothetical protein